MAVKIAIDAGHGGYDPGAVYNGREEKDDTLRLAMALGEILEDNGMDVFYTRNDDTFVTPVQRAADANESGADYFVSLHRDSSPLPNTYSGAQVLVYDDTGINADMGANILNQLERIGFHNLGVNERRDLAVLRASEMPSLLLETGFINSDSDNDRFDNNFDQTVQAIANGILLTLGLVKMNKPVYYRGQVGIFQVLGNAEALLSELREKGYPAFIIYQDGLYHVQVGAYENLDNAVLMEQRLRAEGYPTYITT